MKVCNSIDDLEFLLVVWHRCLIRLNRLSFASTPPRGLGPPTWVPIPKAGPRHHTQPHGAGSGAWSREFGTYHGPKVSDTTCTAQSETAEGTVDGLLTTTTTS